MEKRFYTAEEILKKLKEDPETAKAYAVMSDDPIEFSVREVPLSEIRKAMGLTQKELASKTHLSQSDLSKIEQGKKRISIQRLRQIVDGMGLEVKITLVPKQHKT